jgi:FixJ family two-component response regulator
LVVDDDISVRKSLELLIDSAGWQAETFGSATEFLSRATCTLARAAWSLTWGSPDINGLDLQQRVAAERATCRSSSSRVAAMCR